jgi:hypothetical protein
MDAVANALRRPTRQGLARDAWWVLVLAFALVELGGMLLVRLGVAPPGDWKRAADFVRQNHRARDAVAAAPAWADPTLRRVLGDRIRLADAGRSDLASFERLWALSIRGKKPADAPARRPDLSRQFGRVQLDRWDLGPSAAVYDLVQNVEHARVSMVNGGLERACPFRRGAPGGGGGLGKGVVPPADRFVCDPSESWLFVAPVVLEDLGLSPRYCVWQHPRGPEPIRVTYPDVPLGQSLVLYGGLYYEHERMLQGAPVTAEVFVQGTRAGRMVHRDGEGWKRTVIPLGEKGSSLPRGEIRIEVSTPRPHRRGFCWAATVRSAAGGVRP